MNDIVKEYKKLLDFSNSFQNALKRERLILPYHINVIDELHINENAHSRILLKLLQYRNNNGEYEFLNSLIEYIVKKTSYDQFKRIHFKEPIITQEESRIDLWIRDSSTEYSIIFENKVYNAKDQDAQLSRYIEKTRNKGFKEQNIFIIYLSSSGQEPDEHSWGNFKTTFENRYINLSFKNDIIVWLKEEVLPKIHSTDIYLTSALNQYVDYLEGYFFIREIDDKMNKALDNLIMEHFGLDKFNNNNERITVLQEKMNDMQKIIRHIDSIKDRLHEQIFEEWKIKIQNKFSNLVFEDQNSGIAVCLNLDKKEFLIRIDKDKKVETLYCQIISKDDSVINGTRIMDLHKTLLPEPKEPYKDIWKHVGNDYDIAFDHFCSVIEACNELQQGL